MCPMRISTITAMYGRFVKAVDYLKGGGTGGLYTRPCPAYPPLCVLPKPGGITRFPRLLLIKPDRTFNEIIQGLFGDGKPFRAEMIA